MSDYDQDLLRQAERDGVRTMSGHHIRTGFHSKGVVMLKRDDDRWLVYLNGEEIGEVFQERQSATGSLRPGQSNRSGYREGHGRWCNQYTGEDYSTRRDAIADLVRRRVVDPDYDGGEDGEGNRDWKLDR